MTAQEQKQQIQTILVKKMDTLKISNKILPYVYQFIKDCNLHQLQNLNNNMLEFKKFIK